MGGRGVGRHLVPAPSPVFSPRIAVPRQERAQHLGGKAGEGAGRIEASQWPPLFPLSPGTPRKKRAREKGLEGAGDQFPVPNSPLCPYPSPSLPRTKGPKSPWLGWGREGG